MRHREHEFQPPRDPDVFDDQVADALRLRERNPHLIRFGRSGQTQHGIDGFDPIASPSERVVWQTTLQKKRTLDKLCRDLQAMDEEGHAARRFVLVAGLERDAKLQFEVSQISADRRSRGLCVVEVLFWPEIRDILLGDKALAAKWFSLPTNIDLADHRREKIICLFCFAAYDKRASECLCGAFTREMLTEKERRDIVASYMGPPVVLSLLTFVGVPLALNHFFETHLSIGLGLDAWAVLPAAAMTVYYVRKEAEEPLRKEAGRGTRHYRRCWTGETWDNGHLKMGLQLRIGTPESYEWRWLSFEQPFDRAHEKT